VAINRRRALLTLSLVVALAGAACSAQPGGSGQPSPHEVKVTARDFDFALSATTVPAGRVRLPIQNQGSATHELEIFNLPEGIDAAALAVRDNVADTDSAGLVVVDEVEDVAPSTTATLTVTLTPGRYALICNLPTHYQLGMRAVLTVE